MEEKAINPGYTILKYMDKVAKAKGRGYPYGGLITALIRQKGVVPAGRSLPSEYYDHGWLTKKGLELKEDGKYGPKEFLKKKLTPSKKLFTFLFFCPCRFDSYVVIVDK
jgi:hypothetical protein